MWLVSAEQSYICADHTAYKKLFVPSGGTDTCEETINAYVETASSCSGSGCSAGPLDGKDFSSLSTFSDCMPPHFFYRTDFDKLFLNVFFPRSLLFLLFLYL